MVYSARAFPKAANFHLPMNFMSNRRSQLALEIPASGLDARVVRLLNVIVISVIVIVAVAIIPARLADWTT